MDEKKRKEKEDVAELLGRGKGKKKKGAKTDTLAPTGPTLSKTGSLEMKPLSKLGALGPVMGGGPGPGALKPAGSLGVRVCSLRVSIDMKITVFIFFTETQNWWGWSKGDSSRQ